MRKSGKTVDRLKITRGRDFEEAVADAFRHMGFDCEWKGGEEASPDIILKAPLAEKRYSALIECCAVEENNEVGHDKVGQLRDIYPTYQVQYGRRWTNVYPVLVGRPAFSDAARRHASAEDPSAKSRTKIRLITVGVLAMLLKLHQTYLFTQDEMELVFATEKSTQLGKSDLTKMQTPYTRKIRSYAVLMAALLRNPSEDELTNRTEWILAEELIGTVRAFGIVCYGYVFNHDEIFSAIRDISNPFIKATEVESKNDRLVIRRSTIPRDIVVRNMGVLGHIFEGELTDVLRKLRR